MTFETIFTQTRKVVWKINVFLVVCFFVFLFFWFLGVCVLFLFVVLFGCPMYPFFVCVFIVFPLYS